MLISGVASIGARGGQSATPDGKIFAKNREKSGKKRKNQEEKAKMWKIFHFAPPDRKG